MDVIKTEPEDDTFDLLLQDTKYNKEQNKALSEERNFLDQHVTGIKEEYVDQSSDLLSEIKFEEDPVPVSFPVVKREPENDFFDVDRVQQEQKVEVSSEENEVERIAATNEGNVSSEFYSIVLAENETVCEISKTSDVSGKPARTREDEKQFRFELSKICFSNSAKLSGYLAKDTGKKHSKCDVCGKCFARSRYLKSHESLHRGTHIGKKSRGHVRGPRQPWNIAKSRNETIGKQEAKNCH
ncbi:hypothetical protein ANN_27540 [Periplaneta americana]|uniref:C2H2-type domain-containing protein n=1 Tax=Periplaneta americana TaxID=6978 RepID=A0ABQ8RW78_PERAM|nr:hypothetical protein ANN_27540 [Periplaneta americana]